MKISEIKADVRQRLTGKWGRAAFIALGYVIFQLAISFAGMLPLLNIIIVIGSIVVAVPINYGLEKSFFDFYHGEEVSLFDFVGSGFKNFSKAWSIAWRKFLAVIVPIIVATISGCVTIFGLVFGFFILFSVDPHFLFTLILWSTLIYIISSIVAALLSLKYAFARLISIDNPELTGKECIEESKTLMKGNILKYIGLNLSFIGWAFLTLFTLGIGMFWLAPYIQLSIVSFYRSLKPKDNSVLYEVDEIVNNQ